jgi:ureidoacrylate peracid hydrolase
VESTLRDAYFQDYWPILIADGTMPAGPASLQEATIYNVENFFGWTIRAEEFLRIVRSAKT